MNCKQVAQELIKIAKSITSIVDLPFPVDTEVEEELEQNLDFAEEELGRKLQKQKSYFWEPGRSISVNIAFTGVLNMWEFSPFGMFPHPRLIYADGVLKVNPEWRSVRGGSFASYEWPTIVDKIIQKVKGSKSIKDLVGDQLNVLEKELKIDISSNVKQDILKYCLFMAKKRMGGKSLRPKGREFVVSE